MTTEVQVVNAFIDGETGGNPAGVVTGADTLTTAQKQAIAKFVALPETAFVSASKTATVKLEFFTPSRQVAHCSHATIATFSWLRQLGKIAEGRLSKETIDGKRDILIDGDMAFMEQTTPVYLPIAAHSVPGAHALHSLGLQPGQLLGAATPCIVNTGNPFLLIAVRSEAALKSIEPEYDEISAISKELDVIGYYVFTRKSKRMGRAACARMFAPRFDIFEEAGSATAAGVLACLLHDQMGLYKTSFLIEQGWFMPTPAPSVIRVNLEIKDGHINRVMAGGKAKAMKSVQVDV